MGAIKTNEQVSEEAKLTVKEQESGEGGKTISTNGGSPIELDRDYIVNSKTGEVMAGIEVVKMINEGKIKRSLQSQLDKTTVENKAITERLSALEKEREQLIVKATIADSVLQGKPTEQAESESQDDFLWEDEAQDAKKTVTKPVNLRNRNSNNSSQIPDELVNEFKTIKNEFQELKAERKQTAEAMELERIANYEAQQTFITLKTELPDVDDTTLRQIIQSENTAEAMRINAMNKRLANDETWADDQVSSRQLQAKARKMYADATKQQETVTIRRDNETLVEGGSPVDGPISLPEGLTWSSNPEKAQQQYKEFTEKNKQKSKLSRRQVY